MPTEGRTVYISEGHQIEYPFQSRRGQQLLDSGGLNWIQFVFAGSQMNVLAMGYCMSLVHGRRGINGAHTKAGSVVD